MSRSLVSICLSVIFLVFLVAPTVITMVDDSVDVSMFYAASEEEEKGSEKDKEVEVLFFELHNNELDFASSIRIVSPNYFFKKYSKPHLNLISPPPEQYIL